MPSLVYMSTFDDAFKGAIDWDTDTFWCLLTTSAYSPDQDTHTRRSDITNEVSGTGYTAGGQAIVATVTKDTANNRNDISFANPSWPASTITNARQLVIYKRRGGAASADELVACLDFGANVSTTGGTFAVTIANPLRLTIPAPV